MGVYSTAVLATPGLGSYWRLDEANTTGVMFEARGVSTSMGSVFTTTGVSRLISEDGSAHSFNGTNAYLSTDTPNNDPNLINPGDTFSLELWFKRAGVGTVQVLYNRFTGGPLVQFDAANTISFSKQGTAVIATSTVSVTDTTDAHHLVVTKSAAAASRIYLDGVDVTGTVTDQTLASQQFNGLQFGRDSVSSASFVNGALDEISLYSTALSAATVLEHYTLGLSFALLTAPMYLPMTSPQVLTG